MPASIFVTVATFTYVHEAVIPRAKLESHGILCFIRDEFSMYMQPFFSFSGGGIKLQVHADDEADAVKILSEAGYFRGDRTQWQ
ncbi:MAG TPA: DUF2007 domain-containing protein [Bacteroidia bacterium]|nr:DUF2007 domain-containing protein [Bacteroidia bacterium]